MKHDDIKELAREAGFIFWRSYEIGYSDKRPLNIDWGSDYDEQLVKFYELVKAKVKND